MHVAMWSLWFLWFLWFLRVEYSGNPLYKPFCAFLVFVDLLWFLCGRICGFWSRVVFGSGLRVRSTSCGLCGSVVLPSIPMPMLMLRIARPLARRACASDCASTCPQVFVDRWSCPRCRSRRLRVLLLFVVRWSCPRCRSR